MTFFTMEINFRLKLLSEIYAKYLNNDFTFINRNCDYIQTLLTYGQIQGYGYRTIELNKDKQSIKQGQKDKETNT